MQIMHTLLQYLHTSDMGYTLSYCCFTVKGNAVYHPTFIKICCVPHAPSLVPRSRACHKHCGLGSNPVINGVARQ